MSAIMGTFVSIKTMADGSPRIILDLQCSLADVAAMGLMPGVPFALARLTNEASVAATQPEPKGKVGDLCKMACSFCKLPELWKWCALGDINRRYECEEDAKQRVLEICGIESRKELDTNLQAAAKFHQHIRTPFLAWRGKEWGRT